MAGTLYETLLRHLTKVVNNRESDFSGIPMYHIKDFRRFRILLIKVLDYLGVRDVEYPFGPIFDDLLQLQSFGVTIREHKLVRYLQLRRDKWLSEMKLVTVPFPEAVASCKRRKMKPVESEPGSHGLWSNM